ncbi:acyltransferase [Frankia sp. RB7]|nr:acyltransferase [Frankia sp. RB7]
MTERSETRHFDHLDGWRGISILLVIAGHFYLLPFYTGRLGVEFFFVLSGRLMAEILFVRETPIDVFYWRRITRIFPAFWLFLGGMSLAYQFFPSLDIAAKDVFTSITFTKNYARVAATSPGFGHIWSLCVEEQAYVILSAVAIAKRRFKLNAILLLWVLTATAAFSGAFQTWVMHRDFYGVYWHTDARLASITLPAALYLHSRNWGAQLDRISRLVPILSVLIGAAISIPDSIPDPIKYTFGTGLLAFGLVTLHFSWKSVTQVLSNPVLRYFGLWSFSLYLWQDPFFQLQEKYPKALLLAITMLISLPSFYLVERPVRRYLNNLGPQPDHAKSRSVQNASSETEQVSG